MTTLYRKYRPQTFKEVVGQNHIKVTLQNEIKTGKIAHAYLFCGPRAVGKTTLARVLAKSINCLNRKDGDF
ncbi:MAG: DNA polymerase III subunit gamma/tau, partial [Patescibacteria group bacterium]|nr:DNA polymerase III subunit gamma/tau [Patescibacteria group bacterium]